jgi:hypothetical protein
VTQIRRPAVALITLFSGAITLDRIGLASSGGQAIDSFVYVIAAGVVAGAFTIGLFRRSRVWAIVVLGLASYGFARVAGGTGLPDRIDPYTTLTEVAFMVLAAALAHRTAVGLDHLDETLGSVVFGDSPALELDGPKAANEIHAEMARSRRHDRPLTVTVIAPDPSSVLLAVESAGEEVQKALRARYVTGRFGQVIAAQLRRSDLLFEDPESGRFIIMSPETTTEGTDLLVNRVKEATRRLRVDFTAGSAAFPNHALTFEQLVSRAEERLVPIEGRPLLRALPNFDSKEPA